MGDQKKSCVSVNKQSQVIMSQCTFLSKNDGTCTKPEIDPYLTQITKGDNPRYTQYLTNVHNYGSVKGRQAEVKRCTSNVDGDCAFRVGKDANKIEQVMTNQFIYDQNGSQSHIFGTQKDLKRRSATDFTASTIEGEIFGLEARNKHIRDVQRFEKQCTLYGNMCGENTNDDNITTANKAPIGQYKRQQTYYGNIAPEQMPQSKNTRVHNDTNFNPESEANRIGLGHDDTIHSYGPYKNLNFVPTWTN